MTLWKPTYIGAVLNKVRHIIRLIHFQVRIKWWRSRIHWRSSREDSINQSINQSIKIYIAPLQDTYSEALVSLLLRVQSTVRPFILVYQLSGCLVLIAYCDLQRALTEKYDHVTRNWRRLVQNIRETQIIGGRC